MSINSANWQVIGHANNVVAMTAFNGALYAATSENKLWVRVAIPGDINWQVIGHANNVVAMAAMNEKLYAATSEGQLWMRAIITEDIGWQAIASAPGTCRRA